MLLCQAETVDVATATLRATITINSPSHAHPLFRSRISFDYISLMSIKCNCRNWSNQREIWVNWTKKTTFRRQQIPEIFYIKSNKWLKSNVYQHILITFKNSFVPTLSRALSVLLSSCLIKLIRTELRGTMVLPSDIIHLVRGDWKYA